MVNHNPQADLQRKISGINWNQVYYFSLVATYGSIRNASDILKLSSSTLSEHISQLEASLELQLFVRKGPRLILTEAGHKLFWHAKQMFESGQRILDVVSPLKLGCYPISIGVVPGPHLPMAHQFVAKYAREFGPLDIKIAQKTFEDLEASLSQARLDFGFSDQPSKRKDLESYCLSTSHIRFYVAAKWGDCSLREVLKEVPLLVCQSEASTDAFIEKALNDVDIFPCAVIRAEYPSVLHDLCRNGLGAGAFCEASMDLHAAEKFRTLQNPREAPRIESRTYLIWAKGAERTEAIDHVKRLLN